jgi:ATP-dependent protease ClpP protease subunit
MFDSIQSAKSSVAILAYGEVSSMSSILLQSACKRVMMPSCEFMIHRGFLSLEGVATTVQSNALWNQKTDKTMLQIYARKAMNGEFFRQKEMNEIQTMKFIDRKIRKLGDWNLNSEEAVYYGFADGVFGQSGFETIEQIRQC